MEEDDHCPWALARLDRSELRRHHRLMELLRISRIAFFIVVAVVGDRLHEGTALSVDLSSAFDGDVLRILRDEHSEKGAFAGNVESVVTGKSEGWTGEIVFDVVTADERGTVFEFEADVAVELYGADHISPGAEVDCAAALFHAGGNRLIDCGGIEGDTVSLCAEASYVADWSAGGCR